MFGSTGSVAMPVIRPLVGRFRADSPLLVGAGPVVSHRLVTVPLVPRAVDASDVGDWVGMVISAWVAPPGGLVKVMTSRPSSQSIGL